MTGGFAALNHTDVSGLSFNHAGVHSFETDANPGDAVGGEQDLYRTLFTPPAADHHVCEVAEFLQGFNDLSQSETLVAAGQSFLRKAQQ